jgi:TetR/AcrR family transcriptional regulator, fatty acid metabolism regulator protein
LFTLNHFHAKISRKKWGIDVTQRKSAILREATKLFAEKGYDATPVSEIARAAGVSDGAVFRHFKDKQDLLYHLFKTIRETFFNDIEQHFKFSVEETGLEMVLRLSRLYCHFYEIREVEFDFIHRNNPYQMPHIGEPCRIESKKIHDKMVELLKIAITLGIRDGSIREVAVDSYALLIIGLLAGTVRMRLFEPYHITDMEEDIVELCRFALISR